MRNVERVGELPNARLWADWLNIGTTVPNDNKPRRVTFPRSIEASKGDLEGNNFSEKNSCLNQNLVRQLFR